MKRKVLFIFLILLLAVTPLTGSKITGAQAQGSHWIYLPMVSKSIPPPPPGQPVLGCQTLGNPVAETFEGPSSGWQVGGETVGGTITPSTLPGVGSFSARAATTGGSQRAMLYTLGFLDAAGDHEWIGDNPERVGTYDWQQACIYVPSATVSKLGPGEYLTLAATYPSTYPITPIPFGWFLRVRQGGALSVLGWTSVGGVRASEFPIYGTIPTDAWVELEVGLNTQAGPGVKRSFAFVLGGQFYGWYHQGNMVDETFDRLGVGIVETNSTDALDVYVDQWRTMGTNKFPNGMDYRPNGNFLLYDFRQQTGVNWQIDWSTWGNVLVRDTTHGLYSNYSRLQSGVNKERMPDLTSGWADIKISWPKGTPPLPTDNEYFAAMVGFRKDINREENLEIIPFHTTGNTVMLYLEAWVKGAPQVLASWPMPDAAAGPGSIPEPGDIIRVRWEQVSATNINVLASYYDASANQWHSNIINHTFNASNIDGVNFNDEYHTSSEMTIDSVYYSIIQKQVGVLSTYQVP